MTKLIKMITNQFNFQSPNLITCRQKIFFYFNSIFNHQMIINNRVTRYENEKLAISKLENGHK